MSDQSRVCPGGVFIGLLRATQADGLADHVRQWSGSSARHCCSSGCRAGGGGRFFAGLALAGTLESRGLGPRTSSMFLVITLQETPPNDEPQASWGATAMPRDGPGQ